MKSTRTFFKKVSTSLVATIVGLSAISFSTATQADELLRLAVSLCEAAKTDDRSGMRKKLRSAKIRLRQIYPGIRCGSEGSLLRVATLSNSLEAATFIATKIGKNDLEAAEEDGKKNTAAHR